MNPLLTKFVGQDSWMFALFLFCVSLDFVSIHENTQEKKLVNIQPSWPNKLSQ